MKSTTLLICLLAGLSAAPIFAQTGSRIVQNPARQFAFYHNTDQNLNHRNYFEKMGAAMQVAVEDMVLESNNTDGQGFTHYKYQQYHHGLPIFGCHYILHEKDGYLRSANGKFQVRVNAPSQPSLSPAAAEGLALRALHSQKYDKEKTKASLCYFNPASSQSPQSLCLAYRVDLHSIDPFQKRRYFIDANTGKILRELPLILEEGVPSKAKTFYYGIQDIISDSVGPQSFVLHDLTRGEGILVYNSESSLPYTNQSSFWDLGTVAKEVVGLDALYCTEKYYDMMLADYHWDGVNGQGGALIANVNSGDFVNAFWDGVSTSYGNGDCNFGPLTTLEVVGHEFTHGMVDYTSDLVYYEESGAINESLADMFGKLLEQKVDPIHFSWKIGHSFSLNTAGLPFRVMNDPNSAGMPAYYKGLYWYDFNDVHTNSSIGNLWFSMIVDGKQGANEAGYVYNVAAIGPDKAGQIVFNTNKNYLSEHSTYNDFCQYSIEVAGNLYGQGSVEQLAVIEAWKAVGLPGSSSGGNFDLIPSIAFPYFYTNICGINQFSPVTFSIYNTSEIAYDPAAMGAVTLSCPGLPDRTIAINSPIAPEEALDITVDDWFKPDSYGYKLVTISLNVADKNTSNNTVIGSFNVVPYESNDLSLNVYFVRPECFQQTQLVYFYAISSSCDSIPAGTPLKIIAKNAQGSIVWSGPQEVLLSDLKNSYSASFTYTIPIFSDPIVFELICSTDPNPGNNQYDAGLTVSNHFVTDNYLNTFEVNNGQDEYLRLGYIASSPTLMYQNNRFFATTGLLNSPNAFQHCSDPFDVFINPSQAFIASLSVCVDYSSVPAATFEFDAALFLNAYSSANNYPYSSMLQAKWEGSESGNQIVYNQPEGLVKHTQMTLPPYFKGQVSLLLYTELGNWDLDLSNLFEDDFVLVDNFQLSTNTSESHESPDDKGIRITPNPAGEMTQVQSEIPITSIRIFNAAGQSINIINAEGLRQDIDLKDLPNGLYWVNVRLDDGSESLRKLLKID